MKGFSPIHYNHLGATGLHVSPLALGTVKFGRNTDIKYPAPFDIPSDRELEKLLELTAELGINLLDTAPAYGTSEARLGKLLKGQRDKWIISTKVGEQYVSGKSIYDYSAAATRATLENSLRTLNTDYLDIVLVHSTGEDLTIINETDVLAVLNEYKDKGVIRSFGVSTKTVEGGLAALKSSDLAMVTFNLHDREQLPVLNRAAETNKGIMVKKALASGHTQDPGQSLRFVLDQPAVSTIVVGTINPDHLRQNVKAVLT
ncbi:MAG: aldo/keto reductase [Pseudomonadales bacterium]